MSIKEFGSLIQTEVFKSWLKKLDKNIVNATVKDIRAKEQAANKTDFILSVKDVKGMYKTITGKELSGSIARRVLRDIAKAGNLEIPAKVMKVSGSGALFFESIGFDTISKYVTQVFDELDGVQEGYEEASKAYLEQRKADIANNPKLKTGAAIQTELDKAEAAASKIGFGYFFHKGHVISIATNSTKAVRDSIDKANEFTQAQKEMLTGVLDKYIDKLEKDDIRSSNLVNSLDQKIYASYKKSYNKYLVEIQLKTDNMESGSASLPIANELRKVFSSSGKELEDILTKSPQLGRKLIETKGSPSYIDLLASGIAAIISGKKPDTKEYILPLTEIAATRRTVKNSSNKKEIAKLKALKEKAKRVPKVKQVPSSISDTAPTSLISLQNLINRQLQDVISANMGDGNARNVLNYRTGRLASSAKVESLSESRSGMITAFYSYMKNPYATFSEGGQQSTPKSRDPKLLISKSIREIAAQQVGNRLRAVNI
jgi:hypothetical protein